MTHLMSTAVRSTNGTEPKISSPIALKHASTQRTRLSYFFRAHASVVAAWSVGGGVSVASSSFSPGQASVRAFSASLNFFIASASDVVGASAAMLTPP